MQTNVRLDLVIEAMEMGFDLYEPILTLCQQQYPQYFENPKGVEEI